MSLNPPHSTILFIPCRKWTKGRVSDAPGLISVPRHNQWHAGLREFKVLVGVFAGEISGIFTGLSGYAMVAL